MRFFFVSLVVICTAVSVFAATSWVGFQPGKGQAAPQVNILSSNPTELILEVSFPGMNVSEVDEEKLTYQVLSMIGGGKTANVGWPEVPTFSRFIAVANGANPQLEILDSRFKSISGINVYPAQEQPVDKAGVPQPAFSKDVGFYRLDQLYPDRIAYIEEPKIIRGCAVSLLSFFPVQYNPAKSELKAYSYMKVRVSFNGTMSIDPRYRSSYFESLFQRLLLNYSVLGSPPSMPGGNKGNGCDFLIITHPDFQAQAESLALWKNRSGISTWVKNTTQTGSDTTSIRNYIQNAYNTWSPPPSFLLLIGDAEFIPVFYRTTHTYYSYKTGTDLYYVTVQGSDFFPDMFHGRISVDSASQAGTVIGKILQYERSPISEPASFYANAMVAGFFQDQYSPYTYEDRFFIKISEVVRDFLLGQLYSVERCYAKTAGSNPLYYYYGAPLPPGLNWNGNATQINNAINNGIFLLNHRDHGDVDGWSDPAYDTTNVKALANGDNLPVVLSINCETGHFDNETDASGLGTPYGAVVFCEAFHRKVNGGTMGIFGHTRVSWSGLNDEMCKGFYDAIWPNFDPSYPGGGSTHPINSPMYMMGPMLNFGKFWMYDKYYLTGGAGYPWGSPGLTNTKITFEMGHWFGDPTMQIWTAFPETLKVTHPESVYLGSSDILVNVASGVAPVESVLVCLMNDEIYSTGYTDASGEVTFACSTTVGGNLYVTATKHNFRPYEGSITIIDAPLVPGDANGDSVITISDVVFLINYLFHDGPPPFPYLAGDANCNQTVDIGDVVFLINYLFKDGLPPGC